VPDDLLPRIGLVLAPDDAAARRGLSAFERARREVMLDLVIVERPERVERLAAAKGQTSPETIGAPAALRDALQRARERGAPGCVLGASATAEPHLLARELTRAGALDAIVILAPPPAAVARLRVRQGARVVEPSPGERATLGERLDEADLARVLREADRALRGTGLAARPRLVVLQTDGDAREVARVEAAVAAARAALPALAGPASESEASASRGDALVALLRSHAELALALLGAGPTTTLLLEPGLRVACAEPDAQALLAATAHLAAWSRAEGELVAARAPTVNVSRAASSPAGSGRCPFCRRGLDESPGGEPAAPGPAVLCERCGTAHHRDCIAEHGRCTLLGCEGKRVTRLGVSLPVAGLGVEAPARRPWRASQGDVAQAALDRAPVHLRVEAPIDDPAARVERRRVALELGQAQVRRGDLVEGFVAVWTPREFHARGGLLRLRAAITSRDLADPGAPPRVQAILEREVAFAGDSPTGRLGRLQDGVALLLGGTGGLTIPPGCRRWPFSFRVQPDHPATVRNRRGTVEETVETTLEVILDTESSPPTPLDVR
jgi:hypothetical protein